MLSTVSRFITIFFCHHYHHQHFLIGIFPTTFSIKIEKVMRKKKRNLLPKMMQKSWKQRSLLQSVFNNFTSCFEYLHFSFNIVSKKFLRWYFLYYDENEYCHDKLSGLGFQIDRFIDNICQIIYLYFFYTYSITNRKAYSIEKPKRHKGLNKDLR